MGLDERLARIGFPVRPGTRELLRGQAAFREAWRLLADPEVLRSLEPEMLAAWLSALRADFPSVYARGDWPEAAVTDRNRFLKARRMARESLARMF